MKNISKEYTIKAPVEEVWKALTRAEYIEEWSGAAAIMDGRPLTRFTLWNGDIYGMNIKSMQNQLLIQEWAEASWLMSTRVTFTLKDLGNKETSLTLLHEGVPDEKYNSINKGWDMYYLGAIKDFLESKSR